MPQSLSIAYMHAVFSTKERQPFLENVTVREILWGYINKSTDRLDCPAVAIGGTADHIHVLFRFSRGITQSDWVKEIKRSSSIWIKEAHPALNGFHWQGGYAIFSVSVSSLDAVAKYIQRQESHHHKMGFQDELRALLHKHGLEWDECYLWE